MSQELSLEKSLNAYRVLSAPAKLSWKTYANEDFSNSDLLLCDDFEKRQFSKRLKVCVCTITNSITTPTDTYTEPSTLETLVSTIIDKSNKGIVKTKRKVIFNTDNGYRPFGDNAYLWWNGMQILDMDIKDEKLAKKLKKHIFNKLYKCNWFLGVALSASGTGLHIYTKIAIPDDIDTLEKKKLLYLTNFRHKYSFLYIACLSAMEKFEFTKEDLVRWIDLAMHKPAQGAFIPYDAHPLINTNFFEDFIYICFDNVEDLGHPEIDWVTYPELKELFGRLEWYEESSNDTPNINVLESEVDEEGIHAKVHYKHHERWRLANTLVKLYGHVDGYKYLRKITSNKVSSKELEADCKTALRHKKPVDIWAVNRLNQVHGFKIKLDIEDKEIEEADLINIVNKIDNPNTIRPSSNYVKFNITKDQYLSDIMDHLISEIGRVTMIEAGPGLGKTEMVKRLVQQGKKVMMILPFTSVIKSKVESESGWYYSYGSRTPKLDVEHGLALTVDKFSRLNLMDIKAAGFDYIFLDESHLLFMSEYRPVMSKVIEMIRNSEVPIILMSGTPTGEMVFFPDIVHIHVVKEETRDKQLQINIVDNTSSQIFHMCKSMARDIADGYRILYPSNEGVLHSQRVKAGISYFLKLDHAWFDDIKLEYYKKSNLGDDFMDSVNFKKTIMDTHVVMCTTYMGCGVDIEDKYKFKIYFGDLCTAAECDQWCNRLRNNDLLVKMFIARNDADGNPRGIEQFRPMNFQLDPEDIKGLHATLQICNSMIERNPVEYKYNPLVQAIIHENRYIVYDNISSKYYVDEIAYKTVMFEQKYRDYAQQLPVFMKGMQSYGYNLSVYNPPTHFIEGSEVFRDLKNMIKNAYDNQVELNNTHIEELLDLMTVGLLNMYQEVLKGHWEIRKAKNWSEDLMNSIIYVKNAEVFEKVVPIFLSMTKMFDVNVIKEIFEYCRNNNKYNFAAINRIRTLINIKESEENKRLDLPIKQFIDEVYEFTEQHADEKIHKNVVKEWINNFAERYAQQASTEVILILRSEQAMKRLQKTFEKIFKCLVHTTHPGRSGMVSMERIELLWQKKTIYDPSTQAGREVFIMQDFMDEYEKHAEIDSNVIIENVEYQEVNDELPF